MAFDKTEIPEWKTPNPDEKPAQSKIDAGYVEGERPAAGMWNWFANRASRAILDLYNNAIHKDEKGAPNGLAPLDENSKIPSTYLSSSNIYGTTTGGPAAYLLTVVDGPAAYTEGMEISLKINVQNTGAATIKINSLEAIALKKSNGSDFSSGNLKVNSVYSFIYNGTSFILQGEGGEYGTAVAGDVVTGVTIGTESGLVSGALALTGNATAAQVLAGQTFYNTNPKSKVTGTMPYNGTGHTVTPSTVNQSQPAGYYGGPIVVAGDVDLIAANILAGKNIFGVAGSATAASLGAKVYATGTKVTNAAAMDFGHNNGGMWYIDVTGLTFLPKYILTRYTTSPQDIGSTYNSDEGIIRVSQVSSFDAGAGRKVLASHANIILENGRFRIPVGYAYDGTVQWIAFG